MSPRHPPSATISRGQPVIVQSKSWPQPTAAMPFCRSPVERSSLAPQQPLFQMTRQRHPGKEGEIELFGFTQDEIVVQPKSATGKAQPKLTMTLRRGRWGGRVWAYPKGKGRLCRICSVFYRKDSYNDIEENCPACFLRLWDMKNKCQSTTQCQCAVPTVHATPLTPAASAFAAAGADTSGAAVGGDMSGVCLSMVCLGMIF